LTTLYDIEFPFRLIISPGKPALWHTGMQLPTPRGTRPYRLVKEYESFAGDKTETILTQVSVGQIKSYRLVFAGQVSL